MGKREVAANWLLTLSDMRSGVAARTVAEAGLSVLNAMHEGDEATVDAIDDVRTRFGDAVCGTVVDALGISVSDLLAKVKAADEEARELQSERAHDALLEVPW